MPEPGTTSDSKCWTPSPRRPTLFFTTARYGDVAELKHKGRTLILLKPSTYMNLSGKAVRYWMEAEKIAPENLLVVSDDIALPFGTLRMRPRGSAGGITG